MKMKDFVIQIQRGIEKKKDKNALQTYSSLACSGHLDSWVRRAVREQKKIRAKKKPERERERDKERGGSDTPVHPRFCFFFSCSDLLARSPRSERLEKGYSSCLVG